MGNWDGLDRRKFPRVKFPCLMIFGAKKTNPHKEDTFLTHTENIGLGGICVVINKDPKMFSKVQLEIDLLDLDEHVICEGKVVWSVKRSGVVKKKPMFYDVGIEFDELKKSDSRRLEEVVNSLSKDFLVP